MVAGLANGTVDCSMNTMSVTQTRSTAIAFSTPLPMPRDIFLQRKLADDSFDLVELMRAETAAALGLTVAACVGAAAAAATLSADSAWAEAVFAAMSAVLTHSPTQEAQGE